MNLNRYHRQMLLAGIGEAGQVRLKQSHALVVGCGALGSVIIDSLARAGVGRLTIIDRDIVEITNLQRQILYDEADVDAATPKAIAAKAKITRINSDITVLAHVDDFNHRNAARYVSDADILLDGLDNFETRYLLNDLAVSRGLPYIYGGAVGTTGVSMAILPFPQHAMKPTHESKWSAAAATPCLRCVFPEAPPPGTSPTCDTAGVLGSVVMMIASHQVTQALKILTGHADAIDRSLLSLDVWTNEMRRFDIAGTRNGDCPCCGRGEFQFLHGESGSAAISMCGHNAVQIIPASSAPDSVPLEQIAARLAPHGTFTHNEFLLRGEFAAERSDRGEPIELTLFPNGRAIVKGVTEPNAARAIYDRYIGS